MHWQPPQRYQGNPKSYQPAVLHYCCSWGCCQCDPKTGNTAGSAVVLRLAQCRIVVLILRCFALLLSPLQMRLRLSLVSLNLLLLHSGPILQTCHTDLNLETCHNALVQISLVSSSENVVFVTCHMSFVFLVEWIFQILLVSFTAVLSSRANFWEPL